MNLGPTNTWLFVPLLHAGASRLALATYRNRPSTNHRTARQLCLYQPAARPTPSPTRSPTMTTIPATTATQPPAVLATVAMQAPRRPQRPNQPNRGLTATPRACGSSAELWHHSTPLICSTTAERYFFPAAPRIPPWAYPPSPVLRLLLHQRGHHRQCVHQSMEIVPPTASRAPPPESWGTAVPHGGMAEPHPTI